MTVTRKPLGLRHWGLHATVSCITSKTSVGDGLSITYQYNIIIWQHFCIYRAISLSTLVNQTLQRKSFPYSSTMFLSCWAKSVHHEFFSSYSHTNTMELLQWICYCCFTGIGFRFLSLWWSWPKRYHYTSIVLIFSCLLQLHHGQNERSNRYIIVHALKAGEMGTPR